MESACTVSSSTFANKVEAALAGDCEEVWKCLSAPVRGYTRGCESLGHDRLALGCHRATDCCGAPSLPGEWPTVSSSHTTCWTVIRGAVEGNRPDREVFAHRYTPIVRSYLGARWRGTPLLSEIDDAVQEVFLDCFKVNGALTRLDFDRSGGFRAFFYGVIRHVALRAERSFARRKIRPADSSFDPDRIAGNERNLSSIFDRAWARSILEEAAERQALNAEAAGPEALRRIELLELRLGDGLPIRDIARRWEAEPSHLHHEYAKAREEYRSALEEIVSFHHPGDRKEVSRECERLLSVFK